MANQLDRDEIDQLICSHLSDALRFAIKLTGRPDSAEELLQDSLVKVSRSWKSFRRESRFQTWFYQIMINTYRDQITRNRTSQPLDEDVKDKKSEDPLTKLIYKETHELLAEKISTLPVKQREVLILSVYEKFTVKEISETLSITEENVYSTLHIARSRLKEILKTYLSEKE